MIDKAVEALVSEGVYTGEEGFRSLIHRISKSYIQAALRGELTAHLNGEKEAASDEAEDDVVKVPNKRNGTSTKFDLFSVNRSAGCAFDVAMMKVGATSAPFLQLGTKYLNFVQV